MRTALTKIIAGRAVTYGAVHVSPSVLIPDDTSLQRTYVINDPDKNANDAEALARIKELLRVDDGEFPDDIYFQNLQVTHHEPITDIRSVHVFDRSEAYCRDEDGLKLILDKVLRPEGLLEVISVLDEEELHLRYIKELLLYNGSLYDTVRDIRSIIPTIVSVVRYFYPVTVRTAVKKERPVFHLLSSCHVGNTEGHSYYFNGGVNLFPVFSSWLRDYSVLYACLTSEKNKDVRLIYQRRDASTVTLTVEQVGSKERAIKEYMPQVSRTEPGGRLLPE